jgi:hypothetical protein
MRSVFGSLWSCVALAVVVLLGASDARADADVSGTVTSGGTAVDGAFVAVTGPAGQYGAVTDATGAYTVPGVAAGTYAIVTQAPGQQVGKAPGVVVASTPVTQDFALTASGAKFEALGVFGGQIASIAADGKSGVFYASTSVIPQLYRTADYGGTWTQVTMQLDDTDDGLDGSNVAGGLVTSGFPGELAVQVSSTVYYSTDFGVTWHAVAGSGGGGGGPGGASLYWGHAGSTNVLLLASSTGTQRADMSAATPTFATQSTGYLASPNDRMTVADGADGAWVAVARAAGTLEVFDLAENPPATVVSSLSSLPAPPTFVRLGGAQGAGVPPDAILVYSNGGSDQAVMATKSGGATYTSVSATTALPSGPSGCGQQPGSIGAITPQSTGTTGNGTISQCFVSKSGTGSLTFSQLSGINNNTGLVFDAGYDRSTNFVVISGDGNRGLAKSAREQGGKPEFPNGVDATAGTGSTSGGVAVNGFDVAVVKDTTFGPAGATQMATMLSGSGGGLGVASDDGGATFKTVVNKGGSSVDWWTGAGSTTWLVFGHGGAGNLLTAVNGWTSATPAVFGPNVTGTDSTQIGTGANANVNALRGVPGADQVFIGGGDDSGHGSIKRADLSAGGTPTISNIADLAGPVTGAVQALAYCPTTDSDPSIADVLLVAAGSGPSGQLLRITGATSSSPGTPSAVGSITANVNDVRAHCGSGTVYVGTGSNGGGPTGALYKSTDGGATVTVVPLTGPGVPPNLNVQVVAVSPSDENEVLVAGNSEGFILRSADGGSTWTVANDPHAGGRNFLSEGIGDIEIPPPSSALAAGQAAPLVGAAKALVGTGGGLFSASVRAASGGGSCASAADCDDDDACTTDSCSAGTCTSTELAGRAGVLCELGALSDIGDCADAKLQKLLARKLAKVQQLVAKSEGAKAKKVKKLLAMANRLLKSLKPKAAKSAARGRIAAGCGSDIQAQIETIRQMLSGLAGQRR